MKMFCLLIILFIINNVVYSQWSTNPNENLQVAVHGGNIHSTPDRKGGTILTYNNFDYDVVTTYLQALDKYGYIKWNGPKIAANSPGPRNYAKNIFLDDDGSVLVGYYSGYSYIDSILGQHSRFKPYVQKIDSSGNKQWGEEGKSVKADTTSGALAIEYCYDGEGGLFAFWALAQETNYYPYYVDSLFIQHISKDGERLWGENGIFVSDTTESAPGSWVVENDSGGIYIQFERKDTEHCIIKYDLFGNLNWTVITSVSFPRVIKDGQGGIIINGVTTTSIPQKLTMNRISSEGEKLWSEEGIIVDDSIGANYANALMFLNSDSTVSVFWDTEWWPNDDLFLLRYSLAGEQVWPEHLRVSDFISPKVRSGIVESDNNSNIIVWGEFYGDSVGLFAQKIDSSGNKLWNETKRIMAYIADEFNVITDGNDGAVVLWSIDQPWGGIYAQQISKNGNLGEIITSVNENDNNIKPGSFYLAQNYPNPFNPSTVINYAIQEAGLVKIKVYDILGCEIAKLVNETKEAGYHSVEFNASNLPSGIYISTLQVNGYSNSKKMLLLK